MENPTSTRSLGQKTAHRTRNHPPQKKFDDCDEIPVFAIIEGQESTNLQEPHPSCVAVRGSSAVGPATHLATQDHSLLSVEFRSNCLGQRNRAKRNRNPLEKHQADEQCSSCGFKIPKTTAPIRRFDGFSSCGFKN